MPSPGKRHGSRGWGQKPRRQHRQDANRDAIIAALEAAGCDVAKIGWPTDLLVGRAGRSYCLEVKGEATPIAEHQETFQRNWRGHAAVVRTPAEALAAVGLEVTE